MGQLISNNGRVSIQGVSLVKSGHAILNKITLDLSTPRIGFVGRNGSGKSTLARVVCGLIKPDQGRVLVDDIDIFKNRRKALSKIGILFQNPDHQIIFPTVLEEMSFGLTQQGYSKDAVRQMVADALAQFGKAAWSNRSISTLSQGQRHLVCLMSVLAMQPAVIVLDEPFTGLDRPITRQLTQILEDINQTILHISHDLEALCTYDRVIWLERGTVQMDGAPQAVLPAYSAAMDAIGGQDAFADITG